MVEAARRRHATALRSYAAELRAGERIDPEAWLAATWEELGRLPEPESDERLAEWLFAEVRRRALAGRGGGGLTDDRTSENDASAEAIFERLTPKQQEVLLLKLVHGFRHERIALIVELSPAHAAQLLHVAFSRLAPAFGTEGPAAAGVARDDPRLTLAALGELDSGAWRTWEAVQTDIAAANERLEQVRRAAKWAAGYLGSGRRRRQRGRQRGRRSWIIGAVMAGGLAAAGLFHWPRDEVRDRRDTAPEPVGPQTARVAVPTGGSVERSVSGSSRNGGDPTRLGVYREPELRRRGSMDRAAAVGVPRAEAHGPAATAEPAATPRGSADARKITAPEAEPRGATQQAAEPARSADPAVTADVSVGAPRPAAAVARETAAPASVESRRAVPPAPTDTGAIVALKRALGQGRWPQPEEVDAVRLTDYFALSARRGERALLFEKSFESATAPWDDGRVLLRATARAPDAPPATRAPANVILLLDVSGSMDAANRLPLVQEAVRGLLDRLRPEDRVGLVTYAGESRVLLAPAELADVRRVRETVLGLEARGRTNGGAGLAEAFALARRDGRAHGEHVVILCTDGDFNMGATGEEELAAGVRAAVEDGVRLAIFGFGRPGEIDPRLEKLAALGRGGSGYVNTRADAIGVMLAQLGELVAPAATEVQLAVTTAGGARGGRRAGQLLPGDTVAALLGAAPDDPAEAVLDYRLARSGEARTESARGRAAPREFRGASPEFRFAAAVHRFAELLAGPPAKAAAEWEALEGWARESVDDAGGYRAEFLALLAQARAASAAAR